MEEHSNHICLCPLEGIINTIAKKWAILVISILGYHQTIRFNDIMAHLDGISPKTLSDLLKDLQKENLIQRESFAETPPRVEYSLTEEGKQLCDAVIPLIKWAENRDNLQVKRCEANCQSNRCIARKNHKVKN
jgi:DNA-binding HxlR family transcriptional regulator